MTLRAKLLSALLLGLSLTANADLPRPVERMENVLERAFHDDAVYSPMACHANVLELLRRFRRAGIPLDGVRVLYVMTVEPFEGRLLANGKKILGRSTREGELEWNFHVVAESRGYVLDLDYSTSARAVPVRDYFDAQFGTESRETIGVRAIPARVYLREYSETMRPGELFFRNWAYFLYDTQGRFPARSLTDFLGLAPAPVPAR